VEQVEKLSIESSRREKKSGKFSMENNEKKGKSRKSVRKQHPRKKRYNFRSLIRKRRFSRRKQIST
jgi:hypothetical protein